MKTIKRCVLGALAVLSAANGWGGAGTTTADFLKVSPDSRSAALGGNGAADASNGFSAFLNPALPAAAREKVRVSAGQTQWILGTQIGHYAASVKKDAQGGDWALGLTMNQWSGPSFQTTDSMGNTTGRSAYAAQSMGAGLSRSWNGTFAVGAAVKRVSQGFQGGVSAASESTAWDAGVFARGGEGRWAAGAVLKNAGAAAGLSGAEALPTTVRAGLELKPGDGRWTWSAEAAQARGGKLALSVGSGFSPRPGLTVRGGYDGRVGGSQYAGLTSGVGVAFKSFSLDYAFTPFGELGTVQRVSVTWSYGGDDARRAVRRQARGGTSHAELRRGNRNGEVVWSPSRRRS